MKLEQSFEVQAPLERVWAALIDVEQVAPCLPGAAVTGRNDDGSYNGTFKVKIGPTSAAYSGKLFMENVDEQAHTATMNASGTDKRGQGGAKATIVSRVTEGQSGATTVEVVTDYHITGRLARFGRGGMIEEISNRLLGQFATSLQALLAGEGEAAPVEAPAPAAAESSDGASEEPAADGAPADGPAAAAPASTPSASTPPPPPPVESEPVQGLSLMASVLVNQAKRNPAPVAALVIGFLVALRVLRRR
jgi:carbon monoxide dehydrogenase subunit G